MHTTWNPKFGRNLKTKAIFNNPFCRILVYSEYLLLIALIAIKVHGNNVGISVLVLLHASDECFGSAHYYITWPHEVEDTFNIA